MKNKLYSLLILFTIMVIVLSIGIWYMEKDDGKETTILFAAGMFAITLLLYLLTIPRLIGLYNIENKSTFLNIIIIFGFTIFPISFILLIIYLLGKFDTQEKDPNELNMKEEIND